MNLKVLLIITLFLSFVSTVSAQKGAMEKPLVAHVSYADSLIGEFENSIYDSFYNPAFWAKSNTPRFTVFKIDIGQDGKVKGMGFSDSADTLFVNAFLNRKKYHDDIATLEKYAKAKSYSNVSILIPVSYEPSYSSRQSFYYDKMESIMKFDKKDFEGKAILLSPIKIAVLSEHNM